MFSGPVSLQSDKTLTWPPMEKATVLYAVCREATGSTGGALSGTLNEFPWKHTLTPTG